MENEITISDIQRLIIKDGDIIVLKCPSILHGEEITHLKEQCNKLMDKLGVKAEVVVLDGGMSIETISR